MDILMVCSRCWVLFLIQDVALRAYADKSWLNIMALSTAITGREVIGFTNQPWLWVYSGTGLYGSYFRVWWAVCQRETGVGIKGASSFCLRKTREKIHRERVDPKTCMPCQILWLLGEPDWNTSAPFSFIWLNCPFHRLWPCCFYQPFSFHIFLWCGTCASKKYILNISISSYVVVFSLVERVLLSHTEVDDKACVCVCVCGPGWEEKAKENLLPVFLS